MTVTELSELIKPHMRHVCHTDDQQYIDFGNWYCDGDSIVAFIEERGEDIYISDRGTTSYKLRGNHIATEVNAIRIPICTETAVTVCRAYVGLCKTIFKDAITANAKAIAAQANAAMENMREARHE